MRFDFVYKVRRFASFSTNFFLVSTFFANLIDIFRYKKKNLVYLLDFLSCVSFFVCEKNRRKNRVDFESKIVKCRLFFGCQWFFFSHSFIEFSRYYLIFFCCSDSENQLFKRNLCRARCFCIRKSFFFFLRVPALNVIN